MKIFQIKQIALATVLVGVFGNMGAMEEDLNQQLLDAARQGQTEEVQMLLEAGANVDAAGESGATPLYEAVANKHKDLAKILLDAEAKVNAATKSGWTPLHQAVTNKYKDLVQILLDARANVDATTEAGWTPLHRAAVNEDKDLAKILLDAGADPTIKISEGRDKGKTPFDIAKDDEIKKVLLTHTTPQEIQSIIPGVMAARKKLGKDVSTLIAKQLVQSVVDEKLERAKKHLPNYPEDQLRKAIEEGVNEALKRKVAPK